MRDRPSPGSALVSHLILAVLGATMLLPFLWMLTTALKSEAEVFSKDWIPRAVSLGAEGSALATRDGRPLFLAEPAAGPDGAATWRKGAAITVRNGNPWLQGSPGDRARDGAGHDLSDDLGQPVTNSLVQSDGTAEAPTRFRSSKLLRYAEPVLVPRGDAENERLARAWFRRYDATWETMVAKRWNGLVPLMLTDRLRQEWGDKAGRAEMVVVDGRPVINPNLPGGPPFQYRDCSWSEVGSPVRYPRLATTVVDAQGVPLPYSSPFPVFTVVEETLKDDKGRELLVFVGDEAAPRPVRGSEVEVETRVRLLWSNFETVLTDPDIKLSKYAWNSLFITVCVVALQVLTSSLAAFAFSRLEWPGRDRIFFAYLATLMIPGVITQIPNYLILQQLGWLNSFYGLIIPGAASAYGTFMLRQFMLTLPKGVEEAARIDGASLLRIWWDIILPMSKPAVITLAIFTFVGTWQSFTWPMIIAPDEAVRVLPVALQNFSSSRGTSFNLLMAASLVMMVPMVFLFIVGQKYFVKGINLGAVKG